MELPCTTCILFMHTASVDPNLESFAGSVDYLFRLPRLPSTPRTCGWRNIFTSNDTLLNHHRCLLKKLTIARSYFGSLRSTGGMQWFNIHHVVMKKKA